MSFAYHVQNILSIYQSALVYVQSQQSYVFLLCDKSECVFHKNLSKI